jgi:hypothetical protein
VGDTFEAAAVLGWNRERRRCGEGEKIPDRSVGVFSQRVCSRRLSEKGKLVGPFYQVFFFSSIYIPFEFEGVLRSTASSIFVAGEKYRHENYSS